MLLENPCGFLKQGHNGFLLTVQYDTLRVCQDEECQVLLIVSAGVLFDLHTHIDCFTIMFLHFHLLSHTYRHISMLPV